MGKRQREIEERPRDSLGHTEMDREDTAGDRGETERLGRDRNGEETGGDWGETRETAERQRETGERPGYSLGQTETEREETARDRGETERDRELRDTEKLAR